MLAAKIIGLEQSILDKCDDLEIKRYNRLVYFFITLNIIAYISFYYFFFLLFGNLFAPVLLAFFVTYIYYTVLRFTLISINVPLHEESVTVKKLLFNLGNYFRIFIFSSFVFTITIPFITLFNTSFQKNVKEYKNELVESYRLNSIHLYSRQVETRKQALIALKKNKNTMLKNLMKMDNAMEKKLLLFSLKKLKIEIKAKEIEIADIKTANTAAVKKMVLDYKMKIQKSDFPFYRFSLVFDSPKSIFFFIILFIVFNLIIPFHIYLLVKKNHQYSTLFRLETKNKIQNNFHQTEKDCYEYLKKTYLYEEESTSYFADSPFNTVKKELLYNKIENQDLMSHFDKPTEIIA
jgi:hypothetical protein